MSGSGSSVYGIFKNKEEAKQVYKKLKTNTKLTIAYLIIQKERNKNVKQ